MGWKWIITNRHVFAFNVIDWVIGAVGLDGEILGFLVHPAIAITLVTASTVMIVLHIREKWTAGGLLDNPELCSLRLDPPPSPSRSAKKYNPPSINAGLAPDSVTIYWSNAQSWRTNNLKTTCMKIVEWLQKEQGLEDITLEDYGGSWHIIHRRNFTRVLLKHEIELGRLTPDMPEQFWIEVF